MSTEQRLRALAEDGLQFSGEIELGASAVVGDPARLGANAEAGAAATVRVRPGKWLLFLRVEDDEPTELVLVHEAALPRFYDLYDEASCVDEVALDASRVALLDAALRDDVELRMSMYEPEDLPWVLDRGFVVDGASPGRIFKTAEDVASFVSIAFGQPPAVPVGRSLIDEPGRG